MPEPRSFIVLRLGRVLIHSVRGARALATAWNTTVQSPGAITLIADFGGRPVMSLEWRKNRVHCVPLPASKPRLTYFKALALLGDE